jgi:hypothetical protein
MLNREKTEPLNGSSVRTTLKFAAFILLAVLVSTPVALSDDPGGAILGILSFLVLFFFPGYLLLSLGRWRFDCFHFLLSVIFGIATITTAFDISARASMGGYFSYLVVAIAGGGLVLMLQRRKLQQSPDGSSVKSREIIFAGAIVALSIAPFLWRSGRFSGTQFVFYGPAGKDPLFHVALLQRLLSHVPPDNFIVSGLRAPVYHYFGDLALAFVLRTQYAWHLTGTNIFDLYFRCYPTLLYFLIGALAYRVGKQLTGTIWGGVLGVILLLGGGGLGWILGALQTFFHAAHFADFRASLFTSWTTWDGVDSILPLVHRPAHYHGLLLSLAAITILLEPAVSRFHWIFAGLLLGLMSGFNFTLAATFGGMAVLAATISALRRKHSQTFDLFWLALFIFIGSLPVLSAMLLSGFHDNSPGFPFRGPNLEFPTTLWGTQLARILPIAAVPWVALIALPIFAYGIKLAGLPALFRVNLGAGMYRSLALLLALVFGASFLLGVFFPYNAFGGTGIIFVQPTVWILALFSIRPLEVWLGRNRGRNYATAVWCVLGLTWVQALASFNFSQRAEFDQQSTRVFGEIRATAASEDVVAYLPSDLVEYPILGYRSESTNFAVIAMTGLDGYFSNQPYSTFFAVPGLSGATPAVMLEEAKGLYEQRMADVNSFLRGDIAPEARARLENDHVRWIVVSGDALQNISSPEIPWRRTAEIAVYRLR